LNNIFVGERTFLPSLALRERWRGVSRDGEGLFTPLTR